MLRLLHPAGFVWEARAAREIVCILYKRVKYFAPVGNGNKIVHPNVQELYFFNILALQRILNGWK
jgi:hypothetical protein